MMRNFVICVNTLQPNFVILNINSRTHMDNIQKLYFHLRLPNQKTDSDSDSDKWNSGGEVPAQVQAAASPEVGVGV